MFMLKTARQDRGSDHGSDHRKTNKQKKVKQIPTQELCDQVTQSLSNT